MTGVSGQLARLQAHDCSLIRANERSRFAQQDCVLRLGAANMDTITYGAEGPGNLLPLGFAIQSSENA